VQGLASPFTINTMPDSTLPAFFDHGVVGTPLAKDGGELQNQFDRFAAVGVDRRSLALKLQKDGAASFASSWNELLSRIETLLSNTEETT
jgi:transaldolase